MTAENPMAQMLLRIFLGNLKQWIRDDPEKAIAEIDKAIEALAD